MNGPTLILLFFSCAGIASLLLILRVHASSQHRYLRRVESAFGLNRRHRVLLRKLAVAAQLPDQSSLLLVPSLFDSALAKLDPDLEELSKIEDLRNQILSMAPETHVPKT